MAEHKIMSTLMRPFFKKGKAGSFTVPRALTDSSRILCIDCGELSEFLFHIPLLTAIRHRYPGSKMDFLVPEVHAPLVIPSGLARQCMIYKEGQLNPWRPAFGSLLRKLGAGNYDVALVMSYSPQPKLELAALASGASLRFGPSHKEAWPGVNFEMRPGKDDDGYLGDRLKSAAPFLGFDPEELNTRWPLPLEKLRQMAQQVHFHKPNPDQMLIGVDPGIGKSGHGFALENIQFLVRQLSSQLSCKIMPLGYPVGSDRLEKFEASLSEVPVGLQRDTLLEMILLLAQCDLFVAGNTDFFHFAVAQGVPVIGLFAKNDGPQWMPRGRPRARVIPVTKGEKVDIETLMEAVEGVTEGRTSTASTVITTPLPGGGASSGAGVLPPVEDAPSHD
ncbi:MAG: glycosyltransferase family 9 protein [Candidatus Krumholzibacteriota bacterium]